MPDLQCSLFDHARDNQPKAWCGPWEALLALQRRDWAPIHRRQGEDAKKAIPALSAARFRSGGIRCTADVESVAFLGLDFDNARTVADPTGATQPSGAPVLVKAPVASPAQLGEIADRIAAAGAAAALYSTWSSTAVWLRFRALIPFATPVPPDLLPQAAEWALEHLGLAPWRECLDLGATRRAAGIWFLPAAPDPAGIIRREVEGAPLQVQVDKLAGVTVPPMPMLPHQVAHQARRAAEGASWARRFRASDGRPLDLRQLDAMRLLEALGARVWPARRWGGGEKRRTSCPWWREHSHPEPSDDAVLFTAAGRWPEWSCSHACHSHLRLVDLLESAGCL